MGKWLAELKAHNAKAALALVPKVTKDDELPPSGTSVTPLQGRFQDFRFITCLDDLTPMEAVIVEWLRHRGFVHPYQLASNLKLPLDDLPTLLGDLDKNRFILHDNGMVALNVYGKQVFGYTSTWEKMYD